MTKYRISAATDIGGRQSNEDWFAVRIGDDIIHDDGEPFDCTIPVGEDGVKGLVLVADGIGGETNGGMASHLAVEEAMNNYDLLVSSNIDDNKTALNNIYNRVREAYAAAGQVGGTTLNILAMQGDKWMVFNIGDSPVLRCSDKSLYWEGMFHSVWGNELRNIKNQNMVPFLEKLSVGRLYNRFFDPLALTQYLGRQSGEGENQFAIKEISLNSCESLILSSDGIFNGPCDFAMQKNIRNWTKEGSLTAQKLIESLGSQQDDNATAVTIQCFDE